MVLSGQSIRTRCAPERPYLEAHTGNINWEAQDPMIAPYVERSVIRGRSYGLTVAGYDIRVGFKDKEGNEIPSIVMYPGDFLLAYSLERIKMPNDLQCIVHDKSSWAREGLALQNTVLEPGWEGHITLELSFHRPKHKVLIHSGDPIAQLIFHKLDEPAEKPYDGKYQNQEARPVEARVENSEGELIEKVIKDAPHPKLA